MQFHVEINDLLALNEHCNVYVVDLNAKILAINESQFLLLKQTHGSRTKEEVIGRFLGDFFAPETAAVILKENASVIETGKAQQFINYVYHEGYKSIIFLTTKTPLYDKHNKIVGILGMSHYLSLHEVSASPARQLTKREADCLLLLVQGKTSVEISEKLNLSKRTIESHIENIKNKLGCHSKSELINQVLHLGLNAVIGDVQPKSLPFKPDELFSNIFITSAKIDK